MARRGSYKQAYTYLQEIKVKGNEIVPRIDAKGEFSAELEDGDVVTALTLADLRTALQGRFESKAKEVRPAVDCWIVPRYGDEIAKPAVYVGKRKGSHADYSSCFMFEVGPSGKQKRENLSKYDIQRFVLKPETDIETLKRLHSDIDTANKALESFLDCHRFDPSGEAA